MDSSLAGAGWERVKRPVLATSHDLKKALFLCACEVVERERGKASRAHVRPVGAQDNRTTIAGGEGGGAALSSAEAGCGGQCKEAGRSGSGGIDGPGEASCSVMAGGWATRMLTVSDQGVLLQVAQESVADVISGIESAFALVEWPNCDEERSATHQRGGATELQNPTIRCVHGVRFGSLM